MLSDRVQESRRRWARLAGLMYLLVLVVDLTGMQFPRAPLGRSLILTGSLLTVPLALGLYCTLRMFQPNTARLALACRLIEAATGILGTMWIQSCMDQSRRFTAGHGDPAVCRME